MSDIEVTRSTGVDRSSRASKTREKETRRKPWAPPSMLDAPPAPDGFKHRWIRAEVRGFDDQKTFLRVYAKATNWSAKMSIPISRPPSLIQVNMLVCLELAD